MRKGNVHTVPQPKGMIINNKIKEYEIKANGNRSHSHHKLLLGIFPVLDYFIFSGYFNLRKHCGRTRNLTTVYETGKERRQISKMNTTVLQFMLEAF